MKGVRQICLVGLALLTGMAWGQDLVISCTSNLRALYDGHGAEKRLIGATFIDPQQSDTTLEACEGYWQSLPAQARDQATLWYAYALIADDQRVQALDILLTLEGTTNPHLTWADPRARAFALRRVLMGSAAETAHPLFDASASPDTLIALGQRDLLPPSTVLKTLEQNQSHDALMQVYSGRRRLAVDGAPVGPDLDKLRIYADAAVQAALAQDDPLGAIRALKTAAGYFRRGQETRGIAPDPAQARWRQEQALGLGFRSWYQLERDTAYRDHILRETLPLVSVLMETSQTGDVLFSIAEAIALDWAGLRTGQGMDALAAFKAAASAGSAPAEAKLALVDLAQGRRPADEVLNDMNALRNRDLCVYDALASAYQQGVISGVAEPAKALQIYTAGQQQGDAASFFGQGEMLRFGAGTPFDFPQAKQYFERALGQLNLTRCSRTIPARTHLMLGWMYHTGQGGALDYSRAQRHFRQAVSFGSFSGAETLAELHFFGLGVPQDMALAHDYASKAYDWNKRDYPTLGLFGLYGDSGATTAAMTDLSLDIPTRPDTIRLLVEGAQTGGFTPTYALGLLATAQPEVSRAIPGRQRGRDILSNLPSHVGDFERGFQQRAGSDQDAHWATMNAALDGQINLAFTPARYDTVAAIHHDPARALAFYQALGDDHPVAKKMLALDRFAYLDDRAQRRVGNGPITLAQVVERRLADQLAPLPLSLLLGCQSC